MSRIPRNIETANSIKYRKRQSRSFHQLRHIRFRVGCFTVSMESRLTQPELVLLGAQFHCAGVASERVLKVVSVGRLQMSGQCYVRAKTLVSLATPWDLTFEVGSGVFEKIKPSGLSVFCTYFLNMEKKRRSRRTCADSSPST